MHNNISALYTRHITSLPITRFYDKSENLTQMLHNNISAIYKMEKIEPNCTIYISAIAHLLDQINQKVNYNYKI